MSNSTNPNSAAAPAPAPIISRTRSRSLSTTDMSNAPIQIPLGRSPTTTAAPTSPTLTSSSLSASLRAFSLVSSPPTSLDSTEFKQAFHHARSASFSGGNAVRPIIIPDNVDPVIGTGGGSLATTVPGMSTSPTSAASESLATPPSTSPQTPSVVGGGVPMKNGRASSAKGVALDGVCEREELAFEADPEGHELLSMTAPAAPISTSGGLGVGSPPVQSALFANGARWGWPQSGGGGGGGGSTTTTTSGGSALGTSPPSPPGHVRRGSLPPMAPLGRVVSAGAAPSSGGGGGGAADGFGLFRRLSVGGFGSGNKVRSPPSFPYPSTPTLTSLCPHALAEQIPSSSHRPISPNRRSNSYSNPSNLSSRQRRRT